MQVLRVSGPGDPRVSVYQSVSDAELLRQRGQFVAEGRLVVERLIAERRFAIQSVLLSEAAYRALEPALETLDRDVPVYVCAGGDFLGITGYDVHRGCLALAERPAPLSLDALLRHAEVIVALEGVTNADNVGGVFRNAAAFGADAVLLDGASCDPLYRKAIRTSMAATLRVPFARLADRASEWPSALAALRGRGFTIVATSRQVRAAAWQRGSGPERCLVSRRRSSRADSRQSGGGLAEPCRCRRHRAVSSLYGTGCRFGWLIDCTGVSTIAVTPRERR